MAKPLNNREKIIEIIGDDTEVIFYDGFDDAIIGTAERLNLNPVVAYDLNKCIKILMKDMVVDDSELEDGQTAEDKKYEMAQEYFDYNVIGSWVGESTPIFINTIKSIE